MTFKRITGAVGGDASHFGGLDVNKFSDIFGGTDISSGETLDINTPFKFRDSKLRLRNAANTFEYIFAPAAISTDRTITLPLLTGNDTLVTAAFAQIVTNKTINTTDNSVIATSQATGDILKNDSTKFVRLARGTGGQYLKVNGASTDIGWESDSLVVALNDLQDATITSPARHQYLEYNGIDWVNSTELIGPTSLKLGEWFTLGTTDVGTGLLSASMTLTGTITREFDSSFGRNTKVEEGSVTITRGLKQDISMYRMEVGSRFYASYEASTSSNTIVMMGFSSSSSYPTNCDAPFESGISGISVNTRNADNGGGTIKALHNDATGSTVVDNTGILESSNSARHIVEIMLSSTDAKVYVDGSLTNTITTDIPATGVDLFPMWLMQRNGGGTKRLRIYKAAVVSK